MKKRIYLDHAATTPVHPEVARAMQPYFGEVFGNPSSGHAFGREARAAVDAARREVAGLIGAGAEEVIFTSGGTEANNLALKGFAEANGRRGNHLITTAVEHHSVLESCHYLARRGFEVTFLPVDKHGRVDPDDVREAVTPETILISVMHANNEVGTVQPVAEIAGIARRRGVCLHVDAVQSAGVLQFSVREIGADLVSFSAHKMYGPKGVGALYVRQGVRLQPVMNGGGQEERRRAGTKDVAGIVGFARALRLAAEEGVERRERLTQLREQFLRGVTSRLEGVWLNGHPVLRLPGNLHLGFEGVEGSVLVHNLDLRGIAASTGSACSFGKPQPSHVLTAMGLSRREAYSGVRFTLGRATTAAEIGRTVEVLCREAARLRSAAGKDCPVPGVEKPAGS